MKVKLEMCAWSYEIIKEEFFELNPEGSFLDKATPPESSSPVPKLGSFDPTEAAPQKDSPTP
jgi:hypothetical protein